MKITLKKYLPEETFTRRFLIFGLVLSSTALFLNIALLRLLPPEVPVFYSNPWGRQQLAPPYLLPVPILLSFLFLGINIYLAKKFFGENSFLKNILDVGTALILLLSAVTVLRIILLVI